MPCSRVVLQVCKALGTLLRAPLGLVAVMDLYIMYQQYACDMCMCVIRDGQGFLFFSKGQQNKSRQHLPKKGQSNKVK